MANRKEVKGQVDKNDMSRAYEKYAKEFTPRPKYFLNCLKAFAAGGAICCIALYLKNLLLSGAGGMSEEDAGAFVSIILVCSAQLLTGLGLFDTIAKYCGAGVIVPITGFANSMVAPAIEYKKEGVILGVGAKLFSVAGPVLACGISLATLVGMVYWVLYRFGILSV